MQPERVIRPEDSPLAEMYQKYAPEIFAYLRLHTPTREDAEDLLVEVFLAALEQARFQAIPTEKQRAWLWRVARYKTVDLYRNTKQRPSARLEVLANALYFDEEFEPEQYTMRVERSMQISRRIQRLPASQRQVIYLHFVYGLRSRCIARIMQRREGTVRTLLSRALNALRAMTNWEEHHDRF